MNLKYIIKRREDKPMNKRNTRYGACRSKNHARRVKNQSLWINVMRWYKWELELCTYTQLKWGVLSRRKTSLQEGGMGPYNKGTHPKGWLVRPMQIYKNTVKRVISHKWPHVKISIIPTDAKYATCSNYHIKKCLTWADSKTNIHPI
jgi:hypothetical protein